MATDPIEVAGFACLIVGVVGVIGESRRRCILTAALQDPRFLYVMRLQTDENHLPLHEPVFRNLVRSCKRLPAPAVADVLGVAHWAL